MGELKKGDNYSASESAEVIKTVEASVEVGKSYLHRHDITMTANVEFISKKGHIIANLESKGEEFSAKVVSDEISGTVPYPSETYTNASQFFEMYYPAEEGKKVFKEFTSKIYSKL